MSVDTSFNSNPKSLDDLDDENGAQRIQLAFKINEGTTIIKKQALKFVFDYLGPKHVDKLKENKDFAGKFHTFLEQLSFEQEFIEAADSFFRALLTTAAVDTATHEDGIIHLWNKFFKDPHDVAHHIICSQFACWSPRICHDRT